MPQESFEDRTVVPAEVAMQDDWAVELIAWLASRPRIEERYTLEQRIDGGEGSAAIWSAWDRLMDRRCAIKIPCEEQDSLSRHRQATRFVAETRLAGQLEYPGIVPVYDLGYDREGRLCCVMRRLTRRRLGEEIAGASSPSDLRRAVLLLARVCDALALAHGAGWAHCDVKPDNVMVGRHDDVYLVDWGSARRLSTQQPEPWERCLLAKDTHGTGGTYRYMAPERLGTPEESVWKDQVKDGTWPVDALVRFDVYGVGAMLYQVLAGRRPFDECVSDAEVPGALKAGPPSRLDRRRDPWMNGLVRVCERAMSRDPTRRHGSMEELAQSLRRFLAGRSTEPVGPFVELRLWVRRNRLVAAMLALVILVVAVAGFVTAGLSEARARSVMRQLDAEQAARLVGTHDEPPLLPAGVPVMQRWLDEAEDLLSRKERYERALEEIRASALPRDATDEARDRERGAALRDRRTRAKGMIEAIRGSIPRVEAAAGPFEDLTTEERARAVEIFEAELARKMDLLTLLDRRLERLHSRRFTSEALQLEHDRLEALVENLHRLGEDGLVDEVRSRLARARTLERISLVEHANAWREAIDSIRDTRACPAYGGTAMKPQLGLVPLWRDETSGLWEFWHVASGERPERGARGGRVVMAPETGVVLVLVPGGSARLGAQGHDPEGERFDPVVAGRLAARLRAKGEEVTPEGLRSEWLPECDDTTAHLAPFFVSKYELTQAQYARLTGDWPSENTPTVWGRGMRMPTSAIHPVEHVSAETCDRELRRWGLALPTAAQWEYVARAGTDTPYWMGKAAEDVIGRANYLDAGSNGSISSAERSLFDPGHDGYAHHAPVDAFDPNPFGLHQVLGNVWEWTSDWYISKREELETRPTGDGRRSVEIARTREYRGGGFESPLVDLRVTAVRHKLASGRDETIGVRPVMALDEGTETDASAPANEGRTP